MGEVVGEETCLWLSRQLDKGAVTYMHLRYT